MTQHGSPGINQAPAWAGLPAAGRPENIPAQAEQKYRNALVQLLLQVESQGQEAIPLTTAIRINTAAVTRVQRMTKAVRLAAGVGKTAFTVTVALNAGPSPTIIAALTRGKLAELERISHNTELDDADLLATLAHYERPITPEEGRRMRQIIDADRPASPLSPRRRGRR
ncbi:hypothetical protein [Streptomyces gardneri]|uniref:hypothetical protein n=1 Tax=Streptomyces gardneri TaxID=66892 RepID=UPI0035E39367